MFDRHMVEVLLPIVNDLDYHARLQEYVAHQIEIYRNRLEAEENPLHRGALKALRDFQKLKERVISDRDTIEKKR